MDIKWKDGKGNILNVNKDRIIYLDVETNIKTVVKNEEIKKITIVDGMMNLFKDFENDLILTVIIPKKHKRNAVKIYNEYDKTGKMLKRNTGNFLINLILESSVITYNPFTGILAILLVLVTAFAVLVTLPMRIFGEEVGLIVSRLVIIGAVSYIAVTYILTKIKRKRFKEI